MEKEKGITLIALVITIIVLLILAGISIATLTGENGILTKANAAKEEHKIAQYKEELNLIIAEEITERKVSKKEEPMIESLEKKITKKEWVAKTSRENAEGTSEEYLIVESKEGYEFIIVVDNEKGTAEIMPGSKTPGEKYMITYDPNGGVGDQKNVEVRSGFYKILEKNTFTKEDYVFVGWCEKQEPDEEAKPYSEESKYQPRGDVTLYAIWSLNVATITFDANTGTGSMDAKKVTKKQDTTLPVNTFTKEDYDFVKWNTQADGTGTDYEDSSIINIEDNITLYAIWKSKPITADTIKKDPSTFYGSIVTNYSAKTIDGKNYNDAVANWKIFYADDNNIYLIADDYIAYNYAPKGKGGNSLNKGNTDYKLYFTNILPDYAGSSDITDERIKALNSDYFTKEYSSSQEKMKAVAYMLDTNVWSGFAGNRADYAIGGPTIEMLMKSYSQKYRVDYKTEANNSGGYIVSKNGGTTWENTSAGMLNKNDSLYVINSTEKANSMWIASPLSVNVAYSGSCLVVANSSGGISNGFTSGTLNGFRPLVCLNSDVQLEKISDGMYEIKEN